MRREHLVWGVTEAGDLRIISNKERRKSDIIHLFTQSTRFYIAINQSFLKFPQTRKSLKALKILELCNRVIRGRPGFPQNGLSEIVTARLQL